VIVEDIPPWYH